VKNGGTFVNTNLTVRRTARENGLAQALTVLCGEALPGVLPCGPGGHAVVPAVVAATADRIWQDGRGYDRAAGEEEVLRRGGPLVALRHRPGGHADIVDHGGWTLGLVWLRLGLSEGLLDACVRYLDSRACGDSTVLRQQMVKGAVADVLIEQLEVHAVLTGVDAPGPAHLHQQITVADRALLRLLGASGYLADEAGETAYLSEVLAEAYAAEVAP
jgi:hypothetical protein